MLSFIIVSQVVMVSFMLLIYYCALAHGAEAQNTEKVALHETKKETGDDPCDDSENSDCEFGEEEVGVVVPEQAPTDGKSSKKAKRRQLVFMLIHLEKVV